MAKKSSLSFSEQFFLERGYVRNASGGFDPPPVKSEFIRSQKGELIVKEPIIKTPDFVAKPVTEWFIPYQTPSKKNARQAFVSKSTGKIVNIPSKAYKEYVNVTKMYWTTFGKEFQKTIQLLDLKYPLNVEMTFIRKTNQIVDYFGPGESVFDIMTDFAWWPDDNCRYAKPFFGDMKVDKENPGVKIKLIV